MDTRYQDSHVEQYKILSEPSCFTDDSQNLEMNLEPVTITGQKHQYLQSMTSSAYTSAEKD